MRLKFTTFDHLVNEIPINDYFGVTGNKVLSTGYTKVKLVVLDIGKFKRDLSVYEQQLLSSEDATSASRDDHHRVAGDKEPERVDEQEKIIAVRSKVDLGQLIKLNLVEVILVQNVEKLIGYLTLLELGEIDITERKEDALLHDTRGLETNDDNYNDIGDDSSGAITDSETELTQSGQNLADTTGKRDQSSGSHNIRRTNTTKIIIWNLFNNLADSGHQIYKDSASEGLNEYSYLNCIQPSQFHAPGINGLIWQLHNLNDNIEEEYSAQHQDRYSELRPAKHLSSSKLELELCEDPELFGKWSLLPVALFSDKILSNEERAEDEQQGAEDEDYSEDEDMSGTNRKSTRTGTKDDEGSTGGANAVGRGYKSLLELYERLMACHKETKGEGDGNSPNTFPNTREEEIERLELEQAALAYSSQISGVQQKTTDKLNEKENFLENLQTLRNQADDWFEKRNLQDGRNVKYVYFDNLLSRWFNI